MPFCAPEANERRSETVVGKQSICGHVLMAEVAISPRIGCLEAGVANDRTREDQSGSRAMLRKLSWAGEDRSIAFSPVKFALWFRPKGTSRGTSGLSSPTCGLGLRGACQKLVRAKKAKKRFRRASLHDSIGSGLFGFVPHQPT